MPKNQVLSRLLEVKVICKFITDFPTMINNTRTYITFKSAVTHKQTRHPGYNTSTPL